MELDKILRTIVDIWNVATIINLGDRYLLQIVTENAVLQFVKKKDSFTWEPVIGCGQAKVKEK